MKTMKVKGFTLIELIVVMATFSIIMFGAMQLLQPVSKLMIQSETHESGNAAANSISSFLEGQLSTAEYLAVTDGTLDDTERAALVEDFVNRYYRGIVSDGATPSSTDKFAKGKIHVLQINNDNMGQVSTWVYNADFAPSGAITLDTSKTQEWAVNKAYFSDYDFEIKAGSFDMVREFDTEPAALVSTFTPTSTRLTIKATTNRINTEYNFLSTANISLVNIYNRGGGPVQGLYYVIDEGYMTNPDGSYVLKPGAPAGTTDPAYYETTKVLCDIGQEAPLKLRVPAKIDRSISTNPLGSGNGKGYTFVYTYGVEIDMS